jgi:hypothetical protein
VQQVTGIITALATKAARRLDALAEDEEWAANGGGSQSTVGRAAAASGRGTVAAARSRRGASESGGAAAGSGGAAHAGRAAAGGAGAGARQQPRQQLTLAHAFAKRPKLTQQQEAQQLDAAALGLMDVDLPADGAGPAIKTPQQRADAEVTRYLSGADFHARGCTLSNALATFWEREDIKRLFPLLCLVARTVFGHPASAGGIERDFGVAALMLTNKRSLTDVAFVEMVLFLHANMEHIPLPCNIPIILQQFVADHIPGRLRTVDDIKEFARLSADMYAQVEEED